MERQKIIELEQKHADGYEKQPQAADEISEWELEQVWCEYEPEETQ